MDREEFKQHILSCANTGALVQLPNELDGVTCGNIMADIAGSLIDSGEHIKAMIILNERQRLNV